MTPLALTEALRTISLDTTATRDERLYRALVRVLSVIEKTHPEAVKILSAMLEADRG